MNADSRNRNQALVPRRVILFYVFVLASVAVLVVRLVDLQVLKRDHYRQLAEAQSKSHVYVRVKRGEILDRNLRELAVSVESGSVGSHAGQVPDPGKAADALAPFLPLSPEEIQKTLVSNTGFTYLARKIPPHQVTTINALDLKGIQVDWDVKRTYPQWKLAAHVLGFVGVENEGLGGVEYLYDGLMRGEKTRVNLKVDGRRHVYNREFSDTGTGANILVLNLDESIQYSVEQILAETVREWKAASGSAIVMDVNTGEILALASHPTYNPNDYTNYGPEEKRNRAILDIYEPGSTFKLVTLSAALEEGLVEPGELVDCRVGTVRLGRKVYREAKRSYGTLTFEEILAKSSNVGTIKMGLRLGEEQLYSYIRRFGFGSKTGVELPGEQVGLLVPPERWSRISIGALSIGQEIGVTPIQMVRALAVFGNGGYLVKPRLVRHILSEDGKVFEESRVERERVLSAETVRTIRNAMGMVVERGTGRRARPAGYSAGGKTGTAQKFVDGSYSRTRFRRLVCRNRPSHESRAGRAGRHRRASSPPLRWNRGRSRLPPHHGAGSGQSPGPSGSPIAAARQAAGPQKEEAADPAEDGPGGVGGRGAVDAGWAGGGVVESERRRESGHGRGEIGGGGNRDLPAPGPERSQPPGGAPQGRQSLSEVTGHRQRHGCGAASEARYSRVPRIDVSGPFGR